MILLFTGFNDLLQYLATALAAVGTIVGVADFLRKRANTKEVEEILNKSDMISTDKKKLLEEFKRIRYRGTLWSLLFVATAVAAIGMTINTMSAEKRAAE